MNHLILSGFAALIALLAMPLIFARLEDQPHPDEETD